MDMAIIHAVPDELLLIILRSIFVYKGLSIIKKYADWHQRANRLWKNHFPEFIELETQHLFGTRKQRTLPDFTKTAAKTVILPTVRELLNCSVGPLLKGRKVKENIVTEIELKKNANHIIRGNAVVSDISQHALFQYEHAIDFGYIEGNRTVYEVTEADYLEASKIEVTSKEWVIVDKEKRKKLVTPIRKNDGTYIVDGAVILRCEDPYYMPDTSGERNAFLGFMGTHAPGSYASDIVVRVPRFMEMLEKALHKENIHNDPFMAVIEIRFEPYIFGRVPTDEKIYDIEIKKVEKLNRKRKR